MGARADFVTAVRRAVLDWNNGKVSSATMVAIETALEEHDSRLPQNQGKKRVE